MCRKLFLLMSLVLMLSVSNAVADIHWDGDTSTDWMTAGNWDGDVVPGSEDKSTIGWRTDAITYQPTISSDVPDVGFFSLAGGTVTVTSTGRIDCVDSAAYNGEANMGNTSNRGTCTLLMNGGTFTDDMAMFAGRRETAIIHMNDSASRLLSTKLKMGHTHNNSLSEQGGFGHVKLDAGMVVAKAFYLYKVDDTAYGHGPHHITGTCDLSGGTLVVPDDELFEMDAKLTEYIADGRLTAWGKYGGGGTVNRTYTSSPLPSFLGGNVIVVTGIPEPATIALLGLGGLVLLRRRHR